MTLARNNADLKATVALKSTTASPTFTGTPAAPTANAGTSTTQLATTAFASTGIANLIDSSPAALNTLNELAAAMGDDASFSTTVTNNIAAKVAKSGDTMTGNLIVNANTGIGVTPSTTLHVKKIGNALRLDSNVAGDCFMEYYTGTGTSARTAYIGHGEANSNLNVHLQANADIKFATNNIARMVIDNDGNVGIKQTSPSSPSGSNAFLHIGSSSVADASLVLQDDNATWEIISNDTLSIRDDNVTRMTIDSSGNVGIGASPLVTHADKSSLTLGNTGFLACDTAVGASKMLLILQNAYLNTSGNWVRVSEDEATLYQQYAGKHIFHTVGSASVGTNITWDERMVITNTGNVGIGDTTPTEGKLVVKEAGSIPAIYAEASAGSSHNAINAASYGSSRAGYFYNESGGEAVRIHQTIAQNALFIDQDGDSAAVNIDNDGNGHGIFLHNATASSCIYAQQTAGADAIYIDNDNANGNAGLYVENTGSLGPAGYFISGRNNGQNAPLVVIETTDSLFDNPALKVIQDGAASAIYIEKASGGGIPLYITNNHTEEAIRVLCPSNGQGVRIDAGSGANYVLRCNAEGGTLAARIDADGDFTYAGNISSDRRLKENIIDSEYGLAEVLQLTPRKFNWITHPDLPKHGFIAQEVKSVAPNMVRGDDADELDEDGGGGMSFDYNGMSAVLCKAIQEINTRLTALENA